MHPFSVYSHIITTANDTNQQRAYLVGKNGFACIINIYVCGWLYAWLRGTDCLVTSPRLKTTDVAYIVDLDTFDTSYFEVYIQL